MTYFLSRGWLSLLAFVLLQKLGNCIGKFFLVLSDVCANSWWKIPRGDFTSDNSSTVVQKVTFLWATAICPWVNYTALKFN